MGHLLSLSPIKTSSVGLQTADIIDNTIKHRLNALFILENWLFVIATHIPYTLIQAGYYTQQVSHTNEAGNCLAFIDKQYGCAQ